MPKSKIATWTGWLVVAFSMAMGLIGSFGFASHARFHSRIEKLELDGELVSLDDQIHIVEDEKDDAITYLLNAAKPAHDIYLKSPYCETDTSFQDSVPTFEKLMEEHPDVFENIDKAIAAPDSSVVFDLKSDRFLSALYLQKIGFVLGWKGHVHNAKGQFNEAAKTSIDMMKLAETSESRTIIDSLLGVAIRSQAMDIAYDAVASNKVDDELVTTICKMLEHTTPMANYKSALETERSISVYYLINPELSYSSDFELETEPSGLEQLASLIPAGAVIVQGNCFLDMMEKAIENSELALSIQTAEQEPKWSIVNAFSMNYYQPAYNNIRIAFGESLAKTRAARIAIALQTTDGAAQRDSWTEEYLVSIGVPREMTIDPFADKTMIIKREDDQWHVYSKGPNSDGGDEAESAERIGAFPR